jgi:post-segregation antitoxin (ccd killing protein)
MRRGPNGTAEKARLILLPLELDEAIVEAAKARGLTASRWIRESLRRAIEKTHKKTVRQAR